MSSMWPCRDTAVLCESLIYEQGLPHILGGEQIQQYTSVYTPPFSEFELFKISMPAAALHDRASKSGRPLHAKLPEF